ncbi:MAG: hypothetical protein KDI69_04220 [Xanthomonadales bacterium]|nr:hypothetical protein [Xanthomonadales bacterium]
MDLCLPEDWRKHPQALCRDDLAPGFEPVLGGRVVCGLRDWRRCARGAAPLSGTRAEPAPKLTPYRAPAWLRAH